MTEQQNTPIPTTKQRQLEIQQRVKIVAYNLAQAERNVETAVVQRDGLKEQLGQLESAYMLLDEVVKSDEARRKAAVKEPEDRKT